MLQLNDLKKDNQLIDAIDWDMTPEEAVRLYLEWGNNWAGGKYVIRSKEDVAYYFVVNTWEEKPRIFLIRRNSEEANELAEIEMPEKLRQRYLKSSGHPKGVYAIEGDVRQWLESQLQPD